jgi:uncharacterized OB-fold protein
VKLIAYPPAELAVPVDMWTAPVWEAAGRGELVVPQCGECARFRMQPSPFCPNCQSQQVGWPVLSGRGRLYSFTILPHPKITGSAYAPALIELDDAPGVRLVSNIVHADSADLAIDMELEVLFHQLAAELALPVFRPGR